VAENTKIAWCDHTVNFWHGCAKVSAGCANCYAEAQDARFHPALPGVRNNTDRPLAAHWGPDAPRLLRVEKAVAEAVRFDRLAREAGTRAKVFTSSMADLFEDRLDLEEPRLEALDVMSRTPNLDWQIVTKRPEKVLELLRRCLVPTYQAGHYDLNGWLEEWLAGNPPANVWMGTTVEDQAAAVRRIPELVGIPAAVRFLSCEPLLGPVDLAQNLPNERMLRWVRPMIGMVDWVIVGGESGTHARPMSPDWARGLRDQCAKAGVPFFFKQWGAWCNLDQVSEPFFQRWDARHNAAGNPALNHPIRAGKTAESDPGRLLDGVEHNAFPVVVRG